MNAKIAAENIVNRLVHMREQWEEAADNYFNPLKFLISLQSCIMTSRTVTFIVQKHKAEIEGFDEWYGGFTSKWSSNPTMLWAKDARNKIEKRGDLETHSEARSSIVCSYIGAAETEWQKTGLYLDPSQVVRSIPPSLMKVPQVRDHGTLIIERRWVDSELPGKEVLDALADVYGEFIDLVDDLHTRLGLKLPSTIKDRRPASMRPLLMDRAIYISLQTGKPTGFRLYRREMVVEPKQVRKRYSKVFSWKGLETAKSLREISGVYFDCACAMMEKDGFHHTFIILLRQDEAGLVIGADHPDRASRYVLIRELAQVADRIGADAVMLISEAWTSKVGASTTMYAVDDPNRGEAITLQAANSAGETYSYSAQIIRKKRKKHKVKRLIRREPVEHPFMFIVAPFQQVWGCLDENKMEELSDSVFQSEPATAKTA